MRLEMGMEEFIFQNNRKKMSERDVRERWTGSHE